jgi:hypothetical protein
MRQYTTAPGEEIDRRAAAGGAAATFPFRPFP